MSEVRIEITHSSGRKFLVGAEVHGPDPSAGILGDWIDEMNLYDPETEELLSPFIHESLTRDDWDELSEKFLDRYVPDYD